VRKLKKGKGRRLKICPSAEADRNPRRGNASVRDGFASASGRSGS